MPGRGPRGDRSDARAAAEDADAARQIPLDRHVCAFPKCGSEAAGTLRLHADWTAGFETWTGAELKKINNDNSGVGTQDKTRRNLPWDEAKTLKKKTCKCQVVEETGWHDAEGFQYSPWKGQLLCSEEAGN